MSTDLHPRLWRDGAFVADDWTRLPDAADGDADGNGDAIASVDPAAPLIVPIDRFAADPQAFVDRPGPLGLFVPAGAELDPAVPYLTRLALIALEFASFTDGRNYSTARLLRERHAYQGELRAVGDVLSDQIPLMRRCGIDAFAVTHPPTIAAFESGRFAAMQRYYHPVGADHRPAGARPWAGAPVQS